MKTNGYEEMHRSIWRYHYYTLASYIWTGEVHCILKIACSKQKLQSKVLHRPVSARKAISHFSDLMKQSMSAPAYSIAPVEAGKLMRALPSNIINSKQLRIRGEIEVFLK